MRRVDHPRVVAATAFALAGACLPVLWFGPVLVTTTRPVLWALFVGTPAASAAIAGAIGGASLLDPARTRSTAAALLRGALVALAALVGFAPLFSVFYVLTEPNEHLANIAGWSSLLLVGGLLAAGPWVVPIGAAVGWFLYRQGVARQRPLAPERSDG